MKYVTAYFKSAARYTKIIIRSSIFFLSLIKMGQIGYVTAITRLLVINAVNVGGKHEPSRGNML